MPTSACCNSMGSFVYIKSQSMRLVRFKLSKKKVKVNLDTHVTKIKEKTYIPCPYVDL